MTHRPRIVLIHATRVAIAPIETAFAAHWPEVEVVSILDEGLSVDRADDRLPIADLNARIVDLGTYAMRLDPAALLYTCSAFGAGIEVTAQRLKVPVLKPNEAMFDAALHIGGNVVMLYTFAPAAPGMEREFRDQAARIGSHARLRSVFVDGAMAALKSGDVARHNTLVARAASDVTDADVIVLAHFSTTPAADAVRAVVGCPVLTSPETAIARLRSQMNAQKKETPPC